MLKSTILNSFLFGLICLGFALSADAQEKEPQDLKKRADFYFEEYRNYLRALPLYDELLDKNPSDKTMQYRTAVCYLYKVDERERAIQLLQDLTGNSSYPKTELNLARAYLLTNKLDSAEMFADKYLRGSKVDKEGKAQAERYLENIENARMIMKQPIDVSIELLKFPSTDSASEYTPLLTADERMMAFTYMGGNSKGGLMSLTGDLNRSLGDYYEDVYLTYANEDGTWQQPIPMSASINTMGHDAPTALSIDGHEMFFYRSGQENNEDLYYSDRGPDGFNFPKKVEGDVNTKYYDADAVLSRNGQTLYFSSDRPGGYGGIDLYKATLNDAGEWVNVQNLGPTVNTKYNEVAPFIHYSDKVMFFSSEGHNSIGGKDVFMATLEDSTWADVTNVGFPVNTTDDDRYYVVSPDGRRGYFSSSRSSGGYHDIFRVTGNLPELPITMLLKGKVYLNDRSIASDLSFYKKSQLDGEYKSDPASGIYNAIVEPNGVYDVVVQPIGNIPAYKETITLPGFSIYSEATHDFYFYTKEFIELNGDRNTLPLQSAIDNTFLFMKDAHPITIFGNVYLDKQPIPAEVAFFLNPTDQLITQSYTTSSGSIYESQVWDNNDYKVVVRSKELEELHSENISIPNLPEGKRIKHDFHFYSQDYKKLPADPEYLPMQDAIDQAITKFKLMTLETDSLTLSMLKLSDGGGIIPPGALYTVQIGAYRFPQNFVYEYLQIHGKVDVKNYEDGITRFTMGLFTDFEEAFQLREKLLRDGVGDEWIHAWVDGKRTFINYDEYIEWYAKQNKK